MVFKIQNNPNNNVTNHGFQRDLMLITCWLPTCKVVFNLGVLKSYSVFETKTNKMYVIMFVPLVQYKDDDDNGGEKDEDDRSQDPPEGRPV